MCVCAWLAYVPLRGTYVASLAHTDAAAAVMELFLTFPIPLTCANAQTHIVDQLHAHSNVGAFFFRHQTLDAPQQLHANFRVFIFTGTTFTLDARANACK